MFELRFTVDGEICEFDSTSMEGPKLSGWIFPSARGRKQKRRSPEAAAR
jgi:hypothetical protein